MIYCARSAPKRKSNRRCIILDRTSPIPLYHQISEAILEPIRNGDLKPGDPIPTEQELIKTYGVSRITVRRAIYELENQGYVIRRQGLGTYVAPSGVRRGAANLSGFSEEIASWGMKPESKLIALRREPASASLAGRFEVPEGHPIWYIERLRYADRLIIALNVSYLNLSEEIDITEERLAEIGSLWTLLEEEGISIVDSNRTIEAIVGCVAAGLAPHLLWWVPIWAKPV